MYEEGGHALTVRITPQEVGVALSYIAVWGNDSITEKNELDPINHKIVSAYITAWNSSATPEARKELTRADYKRAVLRTDQSKIQDLSEEEQAKRSEINKYIRPLFGANAEEVYKISAETLENRKERLLKPFKLKENLRNFLYARGISDNDNYRDICNIQKALDDRCDLKKIFTQEKDFEFFEQDESSLGGNPERIKANFYVLILYFSGSAKKYFFDSVKKIIVKAWPKSLDDYRDFRRAQKIYQSILDSSQRIEWLSIVNFTSFSFDNAYQFQFIYQAIQCQKERSAYFGAKMDRLVKVIVEAEEFYTTSTCTAEDSQDNRARFVVYLYERILECNSLNKKKIKMRGSDCMSTKEFLLAALKPYTQAAFTILKTAENLRELRNFENQLMRHDCKDNLSLAFEILNAFFEVFARIGPFNKIGGAFNALMKCMCIVTAQGPFADINHVRISDSAFSFHGNSSGAQNFSTINRCSV